MKRKDFEASFPSITKIKVLICGDRNWTNEEIVENRLRQLPFNTTIIHGACRGADMIADKIAKKLGFKIIPFEAKWAKYGDAAGPIRNTLMLSTNPDLVLAFHGDLSKSKGTKDCVDKARKLGILVEVVDAYGCRHGGEIRTQHRFPGEIDVV